MLSIAKLMLSSMAGAIATTCTLPKFSLKHTPTLYSREPPVGMNVTTLSDSLGRDTYKNVTRVANKVA